MKNFLKGIWAKLSAFAKAHPVWAVEIGVLLLVFGMGVLAGYRLFHKPPNTVTVTHTVEDLETKQQLNTAQQTIAELQVQLSTATQTVNDLKSQKKVVIHTDKKPDGEVVTDETIEEEMQRENSTNTQTQQNTEEKVVDNKQTQQVDESKLHLDTTTTKTVTQQPSSPFSATAGFGYMWDFSNPGAKGSMYSSLNVGYNVFWIFGVEAWVFDPINNPTKPSVGGGVYLDFAKLFGVK